MADSLYSHLAWCTEPKPLLCSFRESKPSCCKHRGKVRLSLCPLWNSLTLFALFLCSSLQSRLDPAHTAGHEPNETMKWGKREQKKEKWKNKEKNNCWQRTTDTNNKEDTEQPTSLFTVRERILNLWVTEYPQYLRILTLWVRLLPLNLEVGRMKLYIHTIIFPLRKVCD